MVARARTAAIAARDVMIASSRLVSLSKQALRESIWLANELLILCKLDGPESLFVGFVQFCTASQDCPWSFFAELLRISSGISSNL